MLFVVLFAAGTAAGIALSALARRLTGVGSSRRARQSGNVFLILFGAIGIAGLIGAGAMQTMKGPTRSLSTSNHISIANNDLYAAARLVAGATSENDDCDGDGLVEPLPWRDAGDLAAPANGGLLPQQVGAAKRDSWGNEVGYCAWDHGSRTVSHAVAGCGGAGANRLEGTSSKTEYAIAIVSAGPDGVFQTICNGWVDADDDGKPDDPLIDTPAGSDDIVRTETLTALFAEGGGGSAQLEELPDDACTPASLGIMRYDASTVQICREDGWQEVGSAIQASGNFVPVDNAQLNSQHTSNTITFSGFFGMRSASVEGGAGAILIINGVEQGSTAQIKAGDTVAIKASAASTPATARTFTLHVSSSRRAWTITTRDPLPPTLNLSVVSGNASAMNVAYASATSYGTAVRFRVDNTGEVSTSALSGATLTNLTNFEFFTGGLADGCSGQVLAGGANCLIEVRPKATGSGAITGTLSVSDGTLLDDIALSGAATGWPCSDPWGGTVAAGASITAYSAASVPCGGNCTTVAQTRTCSNTTGLLSGTNTIQNCAPVVCANCAVTVGTTWTVAAQTCTVPTALNFNHGTTASTSDVTQPTTGGVTYSCNNGAVSTTGTPTCANTGDSTPNAFVLTDRTDVELNTLITSNAVTITGINMATPVTVTGDGSPQININGGGWVTSGNVSNNQTIQVRLTSHPANSMMRSATVNVGGVADVWSVTTITGAEACETGPVGTICSDGAIYAGDLSGTRLYAAPADEEGMPYYAGKIFWNGGMTQWITTGATSLTDGLSNTNILVGLPNDGFHYGPYKAAEACRARGSAWYLPAINETAVLYTNRSAIGGFNTSGDYWSSSESSFEMGIDEAARSRRFSTGAQRGEYKDYALFVRCIRR